MTCILCIILRVNRLHMASNTASTNSRHNEAAIRQSLESMLKSLSSAEHISYFEFLVIARQLNFRF